MPEVDEKRVMITLSTRAKEAIKVALAVVIVYAIAMQMGWDKPYWAAFTVVTISMLSVGVSLSRGLARSLGTLVGAVAGLAIVGLFPQERWWLMLCVSLYVGFCTYMLTGKNQSYFWFLASFTCLIIIGVSSPPESQSVFQIAVLRTQETALGALVYHPGRGLPLATQQCGHVQRGLPQAVGDPDAAVPDLPRPDVRQRHGRGLAATEIAGDPATGPGRTAAERGRDGQLRGVGGAPSVAAIP